MEVESPRNQLAKYAPLIGIVLGPALLFMAIVTLFGALRANGWIEATGVIVESGVVVSGARDRSTSADIRYRYTHQGQSYENDRIRYGLFVTEKSAQKLAASYPAGQAVTVYVDPSNPSRAVLRRGGASVGVIELLAGLAFLSFWVRAVMKERRRGST